MQYFTLEDKEHASVLHSIAKLKIDKVIYFQYHLINVIMHKKITSLDWLIIMIGLDGCI